MPNPNRIMDQINARIDHLVTIGLADDQLLAFRRQRGELIEITFPNAALVSVALKNEAYDNVYRTLVRERVFNIKMLDGALIQMMYEFSGSRLQRHRLAFFPAPHLEEFQSSPDIYLDDELHGDVVARNVVPFPVRYDYDAREDHYVELEHPKSHLTLGQYEHCRIPVSAPVTPHWFLDFILRNFYHTATARYADALPGGGDLFAKSILPAERRVVHVAIPE